MLGFLWVGTKFLSSTGVLQPPSWVSGWVTYKSQFPRARALPIVSGYPVLGARRRFVQATGDEISPRPGNVFHCATSLDLSWEGTLGSRSPFRAAILRRARLAGNQPKGRGQSPQSQTCAIGNGVSTVSTRPRKRDQECALNALW